MSNNKTSRLTALIAVVLGWAWGLPEPSISLMKYMREMVSAARAMCVRLCVSIVASSIAGSVLGERWKSGRGHGAVSAIFAIFLIVIFVAYLIAPAFVAFFGVATTTFNSGTAAIWGIITLMASVAIIMIIISTTGML